MQEMSRPFKGNVAAIRANTLTPLHNKVFVCEMEKGPRLTRGGLILPDDKGKDSGIHPRWCKVFAVGPEVDDLKPGDWILVKHGRWTFGFDVDLPEGIVRLWSVDYPESVLIATDHDPSETTQTVL